MMKIKVGDNVTVVKGKSRGKTGKVVQVFPPLKKVVVEGANLLKKHLRGKKDGAKGQIIEFAAPLASANVKLICPACGKPARVGFRTEADKKARFCKRCQAAI